MTVAKGMRLGDHIEEYRIRLQMRGGTIFARTVAFGWLVPYLSFPRLTPASHLGR
jgi:hypothetical protein